MAQIGCLEQEIPAPNTAPDLTDPGRTQFPVSGLHTTTRHCGENLHLGYKVPQNLTLKLKLTLGVYQAYASRNVCCTRVLGLLIDLIHPTEPSCIYIKNEERRSCKITTETKRHEINASSVLTKVVGDYMHCCVCNEFQRERPTS